MQQGYFIRQMREEVNSTPVSYLMKNIIHFPESNYLDLNLLEQNSPRIYTIFFYSSAVAGLMVLDMHISYTCANEIQLISALWTKQRRYPNHHKRFKLSADEK